MYYIHTTHTHTHTAHKHTYIIYMVYGLWFRAQGLGLTQLQHNWFQGLGFRVWGLGRVQDSRNCSITGVDRCQIGSFVWFCRTCFQRVSKGAQCVSSMFPTCFHRNASRQKRRRIRTIIGLICCKCNSLVSLNPKTLNSTLIPEPYGRVQGSLV